MASTPIGSRFLDPKVIIRNADAIIANLRAFDRTYQREVTMAIKDHGQRAKEYLRSITPRDKGTMQDEIALTFTPQFRSFDLGWVRDTFIQDERTRGRWYVPYVIYGTRLRAPNNVLRRTAQKLDPVIARALRDLTTRSISRMNRRRG